MSADVSSLPVIDIDSHWTEPPDLWTSRAPARWKDRALRVVKNDQGVEHWVSRTKALVSVGDGHALAVYQDRDGHMPIAVRAMGHRIPHPGRGNGEHPGANSSLLDHRT